ncbi:glycoside hydrolase family 17 protein [Chaetomium sp. MPI-SDFR-AT-0129]|nr:glycoside hydrolase family 17 protein [Chaetomium sp. MPI-SDFR-AT-0129]
MAQPRYYSEEDMAERQPLGASAAPSPPRHYRQYQQPYQDQPEPYDQYHAPPASSSQYQQRPVRNRSSDRASSQRRNSQEFANSNGNGNGGRGAGYASYNNNTAAGPVPIPSGGYGGSGSPQRSGRNRGSPQRGSDRRSWGQGTSYPPPAHAGRPFPQHTVTSGHDNYSYAAAGGMAGIAMNNVAEHHQQQPQPGHEQPASGSVYGERSMRAPGDYYPGDRSSRSSFHSSLHGLSAGPAGSGYATPGQRTPSRIGGEIYTDDPYQNLSRHQDSTLGMVNPHDIADDGDDGLEYGRKGPRTSMLSLGSSHRGTGVGVGAAAAAAGGVGAGAVLGGLGSRNGSGNVAHNSQYAPVNAGSASAFGDAASAGSGGGGIYNGSGVPVATGGEKPWQANATPKGRGKKWKMFLMIGIAVLIIAGVVLGIVFGVVLKRDGGGAAGGTNSDGSSGDTSSASGDTQANGDLNINSAEIQALMNNPDLRKVFPGIDYTPINSQYPECKKNPPSQNNVTRDLAVLSQMTNVVRLYGTDCNQTQMLIHAVNQLQLQDKIKIWLGVWQDNNKDTNARQLSQMWDILDQYGDKYFRGIIVANEILFRQQMTITELGTLLESVRDKLKSKGMSLPVATSDLGDDWTAGLAAQSDAIMANIHPFFAGTKVADAADWTTYFWGNKTETFLKKDKSMNIIAETGWPSQGGTACGNDWETDCPDKAVAGIDELNVFMEDWVCGALETETEYFWFEAFDEPWKFRYNTEGKQWEDHWGLMTVDRKLKDGVKIPDCGGKRVKD